MSTHPPFRALVPLLLATCLASVPPPAAALYKVVGPDGRVTYTDRAPADGGARISTIKAGGAAVEAAAEERLPQDLRKTASRFPVTLYVAKDCAPCNDARQLLLQRGVPFREKLVAGEDDVTLLERTIGARTVPSLTVGTQVLRGLSVAEWNAYLDAAGYPRESRLPRGWEPPEAKPLAEGAAAASASAAAPVARSTATPPATAVPARPAPPPSAPTGLRF